MAALHELLAVEKTLSEQFKRLFQDTMQKFGKEEYFQGHVKTLKMIAENPQNDAIERAAAENRELPTTVQETLEYLFASWAKAEDVVFQINVSNRSAVANLEFEGEVIAANVPVDELMGLENRLVELRKMLQAMPTLKAAVKWEDNSLISGRTGSWVTANKEVTVKTEKVMTPVVLHEGNDKHPAQVEKVVVDKAIGTFEVTKFSGAATSAQKAEVLTTVDSLIASVKQARMRANQVEASKDKIGSKITGLILKAFNK